MNAALRAYLDGKLSAEVATARMLLEGMTTAAITAAVMSAGGDTPTEALGRIIGLVKPREAALDALGDRLRASNQTAFGGVGAIESFFDALARDAPEAGVALYCLGDPAILARATAELTEWLTGEGLISPDAAVLDFGCGIGRVSASLKPICRSVLGVDVSAGMIAEARRRYRGGEGLHFDLTDGRSVPAGPWDLVLLVDSMPYVHQAGLAEALVERIQEVLQAGGSLVILNLSYGREPEADYAEARVWAGCHGWTLDVSHPFRLWDARAFIFRSPRGEVAITKQSS